MFSFVYAGDCNIELAIDGGAGLLLATICNFVAQVWCGMLWGSSTGPENAVYGICEEAGCHWKQCKSTGGASRMKINKIEELMSEKRRISTIVGDVRTYIYIYWSLISVSWVLDRVLIFTLFYLSFWFKDKKTGGNFGTRVRNIGLLESWM